MLKSSSFSLSELQCLQHVCQFLQHNAILLPKWFFIMMPNSSYCQYIKGVRVLIFLTLLHHSSFKKRPHPLCVMKKRCSDEIQGSLDTERRIVSSHLCRLKRSSFLMRRQTQDSMKGQSSDIHTIEVKIGQRWGATHNYYIAVSDVIQQVGLSNAYSWTFLMDCFTVYLVITTMKDKMTLIVKPSLCMQPEWGVCDFAAVTSNALTFTNMPSHGLMF